MGVWRGSRVLFHALLPSGLENKQNPDHATLRLMSMPARCVKMLMRTFEMYKFAKRKPHLRSQLLPLPQSFLCILTYNFSTSFWKNSTSTMLSESKNTKVLPGELPVLLISHSFFCSQTFACRMLGSSRGMSLRHLITFLPC